jgi:hypothetical protein
MSNSTLSGLNRSLLSCLGVLIAALGSVASADDPGVAAGGPGRETTKTAGQAAGEKLGIGFLWTQQSQTVVHKLTGENDFVDLILGPGKLNVFEKVQAPVRVICLARSLEKNEARPFPGVKETIRTLQEAKIPPKRVIIGYNPERQPGTPSRELDELVASVQQARKMAEGYGAPLLVGPGLREMQGREELYPELARHCHIWMIQSQRLQLDLTTRKPVGTAEYRKGIQKIVDRLRQGNPKIRVFVQIVTTAERGTTELTADQVAAFAESVADLVDAIRIYGGSPELLGRVIERLHGRNTQDPAVSSVPRRGKSTRRIGPSAALHNPSTPARLNHLCPGRRRRFARPRLSSL